MQCRSRLSRDDALAPGPQPCRLRAVGSRQVDIAGDVHVWIERDEPGAQGVRRFCARRNRLATYEWHPHGWSVPTATDASGVETSADELIAEEPVGTGNSRQHKEEATAHRHDV